MRNMHVHNDVLTGVQDYRPSYAYWRLVLLARKLGLVTVTVMFRCGAPPLLYGID